jgi:hypothetical protein
LHIAKYCQRKISIDGKIGVSTITRAHRGFALANYLVVTLLNFNTTSHHNQTEKLQNPTFWKLTNAASKKKAAK